MNRHYLFSLTLFCGLALFPFAVSPAQQNSMPRGSLPQTEIDRIIRAFSSKETEFRRALNEYGFKRDAVVQTIGMGGQITGEYRRVSQFVFGDQGARYEKITFFPMSTLKEISVTPADLEDLGGVQPFALEASELGQYNFTYAGRERIDELDLYVFDVAPKVMPNPKKSQKRYFQGRIWVDDKDLQIVKARGKGVPEGQERFPVFETYREQIDGRYWFPTYTYADDQLVFPNGQVTRVRMQVRYTDFKRGRGEARVIFDDDPEPTPTPSPTPPRRKP